MNQPTPAVTAEDVRRIVRRDFPAKSHDAVMAVLEQYGTAAWEREPHRVRLAVLKLADRDFAELRVHMDFAKRDYRDVIAAAEYPGYLTESPGIVRVPEAEEARIIDADWREYQDWLHRA